MRLILAGLLLVMLTAACTSLQQTSEFRGQRTSPGQQPVAHLNGEIWGVYFLSFFPIVTGHPDQVEKYVWFRDTVNVSNAVGLVAARSAELGATELADLQTYYDSSWRVSSLLFWVKEAKVSATAVQPGKSTP